MNLFPYTWNTFSPIFCIYTDFFSRVLPWSPWWHTLKSIMAYLEVHDSIPRRPWWHTSKSMIAYLEVHDGITCSPWWHTLKSMMAYLEVHEGTPWSPWWHISLYTTEFTTTQTLSNNRFYVVKKSRTRVYFQFEE